MVGGPPTLSEASPAIAVGFPQHHVPVYPRINRKYLDIETLEHYRVPWEWDRVSQHLASGAYHHRLRMLTPLKIGKLRFHHSPARA